MRGQVSHLPTKPLEIPSNPQKKYKMLDGKDTLIGWATNDLIKHRRCKRLNASINLLVSSKAMLHALKEISQYLYFLLVSRDLDSL